MGTLNIHKAATCLKQAILGYPLTACLRQVWLYLYSSKATLSNIGVDIPESSPNDSQ